MYALNVRKGTTIHHPDIGLLEGGTAVLISDEHAHIAKSLRGVITFENIAGVSEDKVAKSLYDKDISELKEELTEEKDKLTYQDMVKKYKDVKIASAKWDEYKQKEGLK